MYDVLWRRYWARVVDQFVLAALVIFISLFLNFFGRVVFNLNLTETAGLPLATVIVTQWFYCTLLESSKYQATLGKKLLGIVVVDKEHQRLTYGHACIRHFGKLFSSLLVIGYVMALFTEKKQGLHDKLAETYVVDRTLLHAGDMPVDQNTKLSKLRQSLQKDASTGFNWAE